jgi:hypothetical protein
MNHFAFLLRLGLALTPMGPPMAQLKQGEAAWGASYAYSRNDLEVSGNGVDTKIGNVDLHTALATIRYGLATERMEVFARVGISGIDADHFDSGVEFAGGFGAKVTTNLERDLSWGILAQIMWYQGEDDCTMLGYSGRSEIDAYEAQIAVGPCWRSGDLCIYAGPFLHFFNGDLDIKSAGMTSSFDIDEGSALGGYVGLETLLRPDLPIVAEIQVTSDAWLFTAGVMYKIP